MNSTSRYVTAVYQGGAALIIFVLIGAIAALTLVVNRLATSSVATHNQATMQRLALAKDAIIGWSASRNTTPGMLPCPEDVSFIGTSSEGTALLNCGNAFQIGRLPWRTLKLPQLRDDTGEPLWYALSPGFRTSPINGNNTAQLTVDGAPNSAVAIIFSPGAPLSSQSRQQPTAALPPAVANYLDGINNSGGASFLTAGAPGAFNDRLLIITHDDLFRAINRRMLAEIRGDSLTGGIQNYYSTNGNNYSWAAATSAGVPLVSQLTPFLPHTVLTITPTVNTNAWYPLVTYTVNATRQQAILTVTTPPSMSCTIIPGQELCQ